MNEPIALRRQVGESIRAFRKARGWSQEILGEQSGLSHKFLGEVERGSVNPSLDSLESIAKALDVEVARLLLRDDMIIMSESDVTASLEALEVLTRVIKGTSPSN